MVAVLDRYILLCVGVGRRGGIRFVLDGNLVAAAPEGKSFGLWLEDELCVLRDLLRRRESVLKESP